MPIYYHYADIMNNNIVVLLKPLTGQRYAVSLKYIPSISPINIETFHEIKEDAAGWKSKPFLSLSDYLMLCLLLFIPFSYLSEVG